MRFLIDAHLPRRLARVLHELGHVAEHTLDLPKGNETPDVDLAIWADKNDAVMVTKDHDFMKSRMLTGIPRKLCLLRMGNCDNETLIILFKKHLSLLETTLNKSACVEFGSNYLVIHP